MVWCVCRTARAGVTAAAALELQWSRACGAPPPSVSIVHSKTRGGTSAPQRLSCSAVGPNTDTTLSISLRPCAATRPPAASRAGGRPTCARMRADTAPAVCRAAGCACAARCAPITHVSMASRGRCQWRGSAVIRQEQVLYGGPAASVRAPKVADTPATRRSCQ